MELSICALDPCCTDWSGRLLRRDTEIETDFGSSTEGTEGWELYEIGYSVAMFGLLVFAFGNDEMDAVHQKIIYSDPAYIKRRKTYSSSLFRLGFTCASIGDSTRWGIS
jgi:hypothetical protein